MKQAFSYRYIAVLAIMLTSVAADAKAPSPRKISFSCERATFPLLPSQKPDLVLKFAEEAVTGQNMLVRKRSDIELIDKTKIFGNAKDFVLEGYWPGTLTLTGSLNGREVGRVTIMPAPPEMYLLNSGWNPPYSESDPRRAVVVSKTATGEESSGGCTSFRLQRVRRGRCRSLRIGSNPSLSGSF